MVNQGWYCGILLDETYAELCYFLQGIFVLENEPDNPSLFPPKRQLEVWLVGKECVFSQRLI